MSNEAGEPFTVVVERDGKKVKLENVTFLDQENHDWLDFSLEAKEKTVWSVTAYAAKDTVATGKLIWMSLLELVSGKYGIQDLSGPVGTVEVISDAATVGETAAERISSVLHLTIFITINVGIFNCYLYQDWMVVDFYSCCWKPFGGSQSKKSTKRWYILLVWRLCFY